MIMIAPVSNRFPRQQMTQRNLYRSRRPIYGLICMVALSLLVGLVGFSSRAHAQQPDNPAAMLVLDASGSMWGKIKDGHKVIIARKAIAGAVRPFDNKLDLGLIAFGHRRRGACLDIQTVDRPSPLNSVQFSRLINQIKPLGKTPITGALSEAAKILGQNKQPNEQQGGTIILLADGPENCRRDPCALITKDFAKEKNLTVHVIAFSMEQRDAASLQCLAKNSGGEFHTPGDQEQLQVALGSALKSIVKEIPAPVAAPVTPKKRLKPQLRLSAHLGPQSNALLENLTWSVVKLTPENTPEPNLPPWESDKPRPNFDLEKGNYKVTARYLNYEVTGNFTLEKDIAVSKQLLFNLSRLNLPPGWASPDSRSGFGKLLFEPQSQGSALKKAKVISLSEAAQSQLIPAGAYKIVGLENGRLQSWFIHAQPGQTIDLPIWEETGRIRLELRDKTTGKQLIKPIVSIFRVTDGKASSKETARSAALNPQFDLSAGNYVAQIEDGLSTTRHPFSIETGKLTTETVAVERALLSLDLGNANVGANAALDVFEISDDNRLHHRAELSDLGEKITLTPGQYRLIMRSAPTAQAIIRKVTLNAGDEKTIRFQAEDADVSFIISNRDDALSRHQTFWRLFDDAGDMIWQSADANPTLRLSQGQYQVRAEIGQESYTTKFRVSAQDPQTIDLAGKRQK